MACRIRWHLACQQHAHQHKPEERQQHRRALHVAQRHERLWVVNDDPAVLQPDDRQKQADAAHRRRFERLGNGVDDGRADASRRQQQKQQPFDKDSRQRHRIRHAHPNHDAEGEVGIEPHAGGQGKGIVGVEPHHERSHRRGQRRRQRHIIRRHPGLRQNLRVDEEDVAHRQKRRDPGAHLRAGRRSEFFKPKETVEHADSGLGILD